MKYFVLTIGLFVFCACDTKYNQKLEDQLSQSEKANNFFQMRKLLENAEGKIHPYKFLSYSATVENRFDQGELSNRHIDALLDEYKEDLPEPVKVGFLSLQVTNYARMYQYREAADKCAIILEQYKTGLDSTEVTDYQNSYSLFRALSDVPPQRMSIVENDTIPSYRGQFDMLMVPVKAGGVFADFVFDTGAYFSTISETYAKKLNLRILETSFDVNTATSLKVNSKLAVADSIFVGNILFENVVFLLMPDEALSFPQFNFVMDGIIGFPVIRQMAEIHLYKNGKIMVPKEPKDRLLNNMFVDFNTPVVEAFAGNDTLLFKLDTGARTTELLKPYYDKHKETIDMQAAKIKHRRGSAGDTIEEDVYELPNFHFTVGSGSANLTGIKVITEEYNFSANHDGNMGQDVITQFDRMILNFKYMYLDFE